MSTLAHALVSILVVVASMLPPTLSGAKRPDTCLGAATVHVKVDQGHPWKPPFGIERVGALPVVHVELERPEEPGVGYTIAAYQQDEEVELHSLEWLHDPGTYTFGPVKEPKWFARVALTVVPSKVIVSHDCEGRRIELARQRVSWPTLETDASARADHRINPVDLGAVLVPHDWLLLVAGQSAVIEAAAVSRTQDLPQAKLRARFAGGHWVEEPWSLARNQRTTKTMRVPLSTNLDHTTLQVSLTDGTRELWKKEIATMVVAQPSRVPSFGAVETKLRYDLPIPVFGSKSAVKSTLDYDQAWDPTLKDVVVFLPNGSRFVFWRGASYCPFWASSSNTGFNYQWAEHQQPGFVDTAEPLMDKELRYQRVRIVESTASRIHVRWTYESVDFDQKRWGDQTQEDFYFYPDGFATRVVTLTSGPEADYELLEFIVLTPKGAYPLEILPEEMIDVLALDGTKQTLRFPLPLDPKARNSWPQHPVANRAQEPLLYRILTAKDDPAAAISFNPMDHTRPPRAFPAMYDHGEVVTPAYWGDHWPLTRGLRTTWSINEGIHTGPSHLTFIHWGLGNIRPTPLFTQKVEGVDTLGRSRQLRTQRWSWLIAKTDAPDDELLSWARSYSQVPSLDLKGARVAFPSYSAERRAMRLVAEHSSIQIRVKPVTDTMNPVFEIEGAPRDLLKVMLNEKAVSQDAYAWDGATLWVKAHIDSAGASLALKFR